MAENTTGTGNLLDTTDCLEAVGVFRGWKNFFFIIIFLCILLLQACFWITDMGMIEMPQQQNVKMGNFRIFYSDPNSNMLTDESKIDVILPDSNEVSLPEDEVQPEEAIQPDNTDDSNEPEANKTEVKEPEVNEPEVNEPEVNEPEETSEPNQTTNEGGLVMLAATTTVSSPNDVNDSSDSEKDEAGFFSEITFDHIVWIMNFTNAVLILTSVLYCMTVLFSLKISMLGRLGGINHITRAFFLSLLMLVLILPWQTVFDGVVVGAVFTTSELIKSQAEKTGEMLDMVLYYMRFCGYMVLVVLLLILSQVRSGKWAKAILRRLEII
jgi:hypothetical protein